MFDFVSLIENAFFQTDIQFESGWCWTFKYRHEVFVEMESWTNF